MQTTILNDLKERFDPIGLVLHGSRVNGSAKQHSDWDIFVITKDSKDKVYTYVLGDQHIDAYGITLPIDIKELYPRFVSQFAQGTVIHDTDNIVREAHAQIVQLFNEGPLPLTEDEINHRKNFWRRYIGRLEDYQDNDVIFVSKFATFYERMPRYFFEMRKEWEGPLYQSLPRIESADPVYYSYIQELAHPLQDTKRTIALAKKVFQHIFKEEA